MFSKFEIEDSLDYQLFKDRSTIITNSTSIVEYDLIRKIETITHRRDIEIICSDKNNSINKRIKGVPLSMVGELKGPQPATIFPPDDRQKITNTDEYPWSSITKLYITAADDSNWIGPGAIIDEFHVLNFALWHQRYFLPYLLLKRSKVLRDGLFIYKT